MKVIAFIAAVLLPTLLQAAETEFEFNGQIYSIDVKNKYCAPPKGSEYEKRFHDMARNAVLNAVPVNVLHLMSCDGVKITNGGNRVFSSIWIKPFLKNTPRMSDAELQ